MSDVSGTPDDPTLARALAVPGRGRPGLKAWDGVYRFEVEGGQEILLPEGRTDLNRSILNIYLTAGTEGLRVAWEKANGAITRLATPDAEESGAVQRVGGSGVTTAADDLVETRRRILARDPGIASRDTLEETRVANAAFLQRLQTAIDAVVQMEESAQRWYEDKLLAVIAADLFAQQQRIALAWRETYAIGGEGGAPIAIENARSAKGLRITAKDNQVDANVGGSVNGGGESKPVPEVLLALYKAGNAYYDFVQVTRGRQSYAAPGRSELPGAAGLEALQRLRDVFEAYGSRHFMIFAAYRGVVTQTGGGGALFSPEKCERLLIEAMIKGYHAVPDAIARAYASRLFPEPKPLARTGAGVGPTAADQIRSKARRQDIAGKAQAIASVASPAAANVGQLLRDRDVVGAVELSPWMQVPFHRRMEGVGALLDGRQESSDNIGETTALPLLQLFPTDEDKRLGAALVRLGSFVARARKEMLLTLTAIGQDRKAAREAAATGVMLAGLALWPFTGGASMVVAGGLDAALVADGAVQDVMLWMGRQQYSELVVNQIGAQAWVVPEGAQLAGLLADAGFQIAQDLVTEGAAGRIFDAIAMLQLAGGAADLAAEAVVASMVRPK